MTRKFRVVATVETFSEEREDTIRPPDKWTGDWLVNAVDSWLFDNMQIESVEEIEASE